jgi:hypothetical protein
MLTLMLLLQAPTNDIVITGERLVAVQAECAKGGCTPLRDAQSTIALAETQFRAGNYLKSKKLLADAVSRNKNNGASAPKPVAALYEAYATVALHEGDHDTYRSAIASQVRTLKANLPADDIAVISATTSLGDMWLKLRQFRRAEIAYTSAENDALKAGQPRAAMLAGLRLAWLNAASDKKSAALRKLDDLSARPLAAEPGLGTAIRVLRFRIAARDADEAQLTKLVGELNEKTRTEPVLLWGPPYELDSVANPNEDTGRWGDRATIMRTSSEIDAVQWADVGFWIRPDGRTAEAEVLRSSPGNPWAPALLDQIGARRYSTSAAADGTDQGSYRVERVTRRTSYQVPRGSLIARRTATGGFEVLDLTRADAKPKPVS